ncbi:GPP34 family phosphoprotein [Reichenbachiella carrageenanivorans]|uniref:GPP34 family phosphoprotein n=1 Tax=Reichenbachiella carrageenanivorans TaxID=2979869 RepID=A0ABY6CXB6_9BACT|nr:GPP34 family phosphoprotein [Reichenbachiella carrageenanivorans]UXX78550.1 GPP34 family phosphoprotein [Reichenbachiella carrageenanivorans]
MKLSLAEGLMLIALDDEEGRLLSAAEHSIDHGLLSIFILELSLIKRVGFENNKIVVKDSTGTGNKVLDNVLKAIGGGGDSVSNTVKKIAPSFESVQDDVIELLVQRGILKVESTKLLWIPVSERMDNANYAFEQEIRDTLKAVVQKGQKATPAIVILMSMISNCKILEEVFKEKDELIDAVKVAKDITNSGVVDKETQLVLNDLKEHFLSL